MTENLLIDPARLLDIEYNINTIKEKMAAALTACGRKADEARLMAVTKTVQVPYINHAIDHCGIDLIGENRVQEFLQKQPYLHLQNCEAHLIGHLQSNKARQIVGQLDLIQSIDSVKLAKEVARQSQKLGVSTPVLLEVNVGHEASKSGFYFEELNSAVAEIAALPNIKVQGLMAIPPFSATCSETVKYFEALQKSFIDIRAQKLDNVTMSILSMGMSGDFEAALSCGSTLVRVGSAIFGSRINTGR